MCSADIYLVLEMKYCLCYSLSIEGMDLPREPPPALPPKTRTREQHSNLSHAVNGSASEEEHASQEAPALPVVPPRFRAQLKKDKRPISNGLPPTPKVHVSKLCQDKVLVDLLECNL